MNEEYAFLALLGMLLAVIGVVGMYGWFLYWIHSNYGEPVMFASVFVTGIALLFSVGSYWEIEN